MDIVTDLTAEAVSYLTLFQDILKSTPVHDLQVDLKDKSYWKGIKSDKLWQDSLTIPQMDRIKDLIWFSPTKEEALMLKQRYFKTVARLLAWLSENVAATLPADTEVSLFHSPFFWRQHIKSILFQHKGQRVVLVKVMQYMPLQVILSCTGKGENAYKVRLYQFYMHHDRSASAEILTDRDKTIHEDWWKVNFKRSFDLLRYDGKLLKALIDKEFPLPFESLFRDELIEIAAAREKRASESSVVSVGKGLPVDETKHTADEKANFDPLRKSGNMRLIGLAFSGGGIRSATYNLGILQRLASLNVLDRFDYISTVSGGGYIVTWLASWIKRSGSLSKVSDRLCPAKSADPLADEVRPIRWLRMFSNYLSPNVGIMSPDAWASGMTWLRNTIINQAVLLLVLLTVLSLIGDLYEAWALLLNLKCHPGNITILFWSMVLLLPAAFLAAAAMRSFFRIEKKEKKANSPKIWERLKLSLSYLTGFTISVPHFLIAWSSICALVITTSITAREFPVDLVTQYGLLAGISFTIFTAFIIVAWRGNYHKRSDLKQTGEATNTISHNLRAADTSSYTKGRLVTKEKIIISFYIAFSSAVASIVFVAMICLLWFSKKPFTIWVKALDKTLNPEKAVLVLGLPAVLEIFSIAVIVRMMIMGDLFPDYRREWWGRIGGYVHRLILIWVIVSFAALILPDLQPYLFSKWELALPAWGGWVGIVGWGVKKAFESKDESKPENKSYSGVLIKGIPFLFMIGFLLIGSWIIKYIRETMEMWENIIITASLVCITLFLSSRIGVNEFSLHHFYRNRLIRAFMGATRSREDRIKTANAFTGFDTNDDIILSSMRVKDGYFGPFPILNATLNATVVSALDRQDRMAESFIFSPLYCGYDFSPTRASTYDIDHVYEYGYRPTDQYSNKDGGATIGTAMAISGAAVNPNWGYHSSAAMAFLLTMFNVRLGWWMGNPRKDKWKNPDPDFGLLYLMRDLIGKSDINMDYVCLSDGGHFDNMGLYELIRRRCHYIILGDGEQDQQGTCEGLANAIRRCRIDFGVEIIIDLKKVATKDDQTDQISHIIEGTINYPGQSEKSRLMYIKACLKGDEPADIREYAMTNPDFPQQSTADQFFDEAQFESYRRLGYHSVKSVDELKLPS